MKRTAIYLLYLITALFPIWLFAFSNVFTMGYHTPLPRKLAITATAIVLPIALCLICNWYSRLFALLFALSTWLPILLLWILDQAPAVL